jgi:biopolymer transport protein ExbD
MNATMNVTVLTKPKRNLKLFSDFNNLQFASVMGMVVFVLLLIFMTIPVYDVFDRGTSVDLPKVSHPISMRGADREDAMKVSITRDGKIYFQTEHVIGTADLERRIREYLKDPEVERKVYLSVDLRARWGGVKMALQAVHDAGILRVAFLADQRRLH